MFQLDIDAGTLLHKSSGVEIKPATIDFSVHPDSWSLENNYNEKSARLKNQTQGISFSIMYLFKNAGSPLPKPTKVPILALTAQAAANSTSAETNRLQALVDSARPLPLTDQSHTAPTRTVIQEGTARPASAPLRPLRAAGQHVLQASNTSLQLQTGADGRVRLVREAQKRPGADTAASVPTLVRRRLEGTTTRNAREESEAERTPLPVAFRTPSPVPTELAAEEESPSFQEQLEGFTATVSNSSSSSHMRESWSPSSSSRMREFAEADCEVEH